MLTPVILRVYSIRLYQMASVPFFSVRFSVFSRAVLIVQIGQI